MSFYRIYNIISWCMYPALRLHLKIREWRGKEDPKRVRERFGETNIARPSGQLIWFHAASIGEAKATLPLIDLILAQFPDCHILVSTTTKTSATLMGANLPARTIHQYMPSDRKIWVEKFLDHWQPQCALWMESEFWPHALHNITKRNIPLALINGRVSQRSFARWRVFANSMLHDMLQCFSLILTSSDEDAARFRAIGAPNIKLIGNVKGGNDPLSANPKNLKDLWDALGERPVWLATSTHEGDDAIVIRTHLEVLKTFPDALCIIVPRHPERAQEIAAIAKTHNATYNIRSTGKMFGPNNAIYIADTLGELGLFYRLAPIAFIGGTLDQLGGHNALEAAQLECAVICGPDMANFQQIAQMLTKNDAMITIENARELQDSVLHLLQSPTELRRMQSAALDVARTQRNNANVAFGELEPIFAASGFR